MIFVAGNVDNVIFIQPVESFFLLQGVSSWWGAQTVFCSGRIRQLEYDNLILFPSPLKLLNQHLISFFWQNWISEMPGGGGRDFTFPPGYTTIHAGCRVWSFYKIIHFHVLRRLWYNQGMYISWWLRNRCAGMKQSLLFDLLKAFD